MESIAAVPPMPSPSPVAAEILVIDDDPAVREALSDFLTDEGFQVRLAVDGADGLRQLRSGAALPALVILDLAMPVMDGYTFLGHVRQDALLMGVPVLILSATVGDDGLPTDVGQLRKPIDSWALVAAIRGRIA